MIENAPQKPPKRADSKDHLANERTYLAWIRTNLGIMAFGFVVEKFSFFIQELASFLGKSSVPAAAPVPTLESAASLFGISLVGLGAMLCLFSFLSFKRTQRQINQDTYQPSLFLDALLALLVFCMGVFLVIYLIRSHA